MRGQNLLCVIVLVGLFACTSNPHRTDVLVQPSASKPAASPPPPPPVATSAAPETSIAKGAVPTTITSSPKPANADASSAPPASLLGQSSPRRTSSDKPERISMYSGTAAHYFPEEVTVGESFRVFLRIAEGVELEDLKKSLQKHVADQLNKNVDEVHIAPNKPPSSRPVLGGKVYGIPSVKTSRVMKATLSSDESDFKIKCVVPADCGAVPREGPYLDWIWDVKSLKSSEVKLKLTLTASIYPGGDGALPEHTINTEVLVKAQSVPVIPSKSWLEKSTEFINDVLKMALDNLKVSIATALAGLIFTVLRFEKLSGIALAGLKKIKSRFS